MAERCQFDGLAKVEMRLCPLCLIGWLIAILMLGILIGRML